MAADSVFSINLKDIYDNGTISLDATDVSNWDEKPTENVFTSEDGTKIYQYTADAVSARGAALDMVQSCSSPTAAFACLAAYYAGQAQNELENLMDEYKAQQDSYEDCLDHSTYANASKAEANQNSSCPSSKDNPDFESYMKEIAGTTEWNRIDSDGTQEHSADEWQAMCDILNNQKEIESNDLNSLSTEMELSIQDSSEAEEMAANAVKKLSDMLSTQAQASGG